MEQPIDNLQTSVIQIPRADPNARLMESYLAIPSGRGSFPGVLVIHEIFGLNENIRDITRRFAREGYAALAVDLFSGAKRVVCLMQIFYGLLIRPLDNRPLKDLQAAISYFKTQEQVDADRVGVVGFCMGGSYALQLASVNERLRAASVFYGQNPRPLEAVARACPIIGSYPEKDFTARAARQLEGALERFDVPHDIKIYPNARHSFFNDQGQAYDPEAAVDSWKRMLSFFEIYLKEEAGEATQENN